MKYRTAAAIAMCLTNGAIAAPTQSNEQVVATHKNPYGRPPQLVKDTLERRDRDVNTAELSEMIQKRGDIGEGAAKALAQTSRFILEDGEEENDLDLKINLSLRDQPSKRSGARMPQYPKKTPYHSRRELNDGSSSSDGSGNTIKQLVNGVGLGDILTSLDLDSITNSANLQEVTDVTGLTGNQVTGINKLKARQTKPEQKPEEPKSDKAEKPKAEAEKPKAEAEKPKAEAEKPKAEAEKPKAEAEKPDGKDQKPSKAEQKKLLKDLLNKLGLINATGKLNLDKAVNTLGVSKLTGKLNVDKLTDSLGASELTDSLGVTGGKSKGNADKAKFTVSARSFPVNQKKPAAE